MSRPARSDATAASIFLGPATFAIVAMLAAPLILLGRYSLNRFSATDLMIETVTPENYIRFFTDPYYLDVMRTTVGVSAAVTVTCLLLGLPLAWRISHLGLRWKQAAMLMVVLPLFIGSTVRTIGWMILFVRGGLIDIAAIRWFGTSVNLMFTPTAVVIGIVSFNLPYVVLTTQSVFEGIDTRFDEAARGLGATPVRAFWRIIWPLALPGVVIAGVLCFIMTMNTYATAVLLGGPRFQMMAPLLYWEFGSNNNWPFAAALAFILMATTLALTIGASLMVPKRYRA